MRKAVAMLVVGALSVGVLAPSALADNGKNGHSKDRFEGQFQDWQGGYWANESLARMVTKGVMQGNGDGTIATNRPVTRLEAAIMVVRLLGLTGPDAPQVTPPATGEDKHGQKGHGDDNRDNEKKFEDDNQIPDWGRTAITIAMQKGFLISDGSKLSPFKPLTRLEAAIMMVKAAGLDAAATAKAGATLNFTDAKQIPAQFVGYIAVAVEKGFVTGYEDGSFQGMKTLTRAEWASLLDRLDRQGPDVSKDGRQVKGTVTAVTTGTAPSITMTTPVFPSGVTYSIDDTAVFYKAGKEITIADITAQDQVIINLSTDRKILMVTVNNVVTTVTGQVTGFVAPASNTDGSISLIDKGVTTTYVVPFSATVTVGNVAGTASDVQDGDQVALTLEGARVQKIAIKVAAVSVQGILTAVNEGTNSVLPTLTVQGSDNVTTTYSVADYATIKGMSGATLVLTDLKVGDKVVLKTERNLVTGISVNNALTTVGGKVTDFVAPVTNYDGSITLSDRGVTTTYVVPVSATVTLGSTAATVADILDGDQVAVTLQGARVQKIAIKVEPISVQGTLTAVNEGTSSVLPTVTVKGTDNVTTTYSVADYATIKGTGGATLVLTDLQVGDKVVLRTERNLVTSISVNNAVTTVNGKVTGFVAPVTNNDGSITLSDRGVTTTYVVPVSATVTLGTSSATVADIQDGDQVAVTLEGSRVNKIAIRVEPTSVQGTLIAVNAGTNSVLPTITIKGSNNVTTTYSVADYATIKNIRGAAVDLTGLKVGDKVVLRTERNLVTSINVTR